MPGMPLKSQLAPIAKHMEIPRSYKGHPLQNKWQPNEILRGTPLEVRWKPNEILRSTPCKMYETPVKSQAMPLAKCVITLSNPEAVPLAKCMKTIEANPKGAPYKMSANANEILRDLANTYGSPLKLLEVSLAKCMEII
jgi:hypothetical protein